MLKVRDHVSGRNRTRRRDFPQTKKRYISLGRETEVSEPTRSRVLCPAFWMFQRMYQALGRNTQDTLERWDPTARVPVSQKQQHRGLTGSLSRVTRQVFSTALSAGGSPRKD